MPFFLYANTVKPRHILLLNSYNQSMSWVENITRSVYDTLEPAKNNLVIHIENMDTKRIYDKKYLLQLKKLYKNKYKNINFELILSSDNNAFDFLKNNRDELFGNIPVSFSGVNFFKDSDLKGYQNYTGITEEFDLQGTLQTALKLKPDTKKIFIINDYLKTGIAWRKTIQERLKTFKPDIEITYSKNTSIDNLKQQLNSLSKDTIVLLGVYFKDVKGEYFTYEKIGEILSMHSKVPVFCLLEFNLKKGVVGGNVIGGYYQGQAMSKIAKKILNGIPVTKLPVQKTGATQSIFDYNELTKHNMIIENLPKNSLIINQPISYYQKHKMIIITAITIILLLLVIIVILLVSIKEKKASQKKLKISKDALDEEKRAVETKVAKRTFQLCESNIKLEQSLQDLKNTQKQLVESEKVASLGVVVAGVAHEINTPIGTTLTAISYLDEITNKIQDLYTHDNITEHDFMEYLKDTKEISESTLKSVKRASVLVNTFKLLSLDQTNNEKKVFNLSSYTEDILLSLYSQLQTKKIKINTDIQKELEINSYPAAFGQILPILIINSLTHGFKETHAGIIDINITQKNNCIVFIYKDDGVGIKDENISHIFEPFYTTNRSSGCTGLGLNILHNVVTSQLNGKIEFEREKKPGVEFKISFPIG